MPTLATPAPRQQTAPALSFGNNVKGRVDDNGILTLIIDTKAAGAPSKSGKRRLIASTNGFQGVGNIQFSINATAPLTA